MMMDLQKLLEKAMKYLLEGVLVAVIAHYLPSNMKVKPMALAMIAVMAGSALWLMDEFVPGMGNYARMGAGFSVGVKMAGGL